MGGALAKAGVKCRAMTSFDYSPRGLAADGWPGQVPGHDNFLGGENGSRERDRGDGVAHQRVGLYICSSAT